MQRQEECKRLRVGAGADAGAGAGINPLKTLPASLFGRVWPRERVLMGLRTSKWVQEELTQNARSVLFSVQLNQYEESEDEHRVVCGGFTRFANRDQEVWVRLVGHKFGGIDAEAFLPRGLEILGMLTKAIPGGLKWNLVHLDLRRTMIGDEGANMLSAVVGECKALAYLNLRANNISKRGLTALATGQVQIQRLQLTLADSLALTSACGGARELRARGSGSAVR